MQRTQLAKVHTNGLRLRKLKTICHRPPVDFIEAKLELPLNGGHVLATVAHKEVVHVHATGHASGDGVCNTVDLKAKEGDGEDAALGHPQLLVVCVGKDIADPNPKASVRKKAGDEDG